MSSADGITTLIRVGCTVVGVCVYVPKWMIDPLKKLLPLSVISTALASASAESGDMLERIGCAFSAVIMFRLGSSDWADSPPPGPGLETPISKLDCDALKTPSAFP